MPRNASIETGAPDASINALSFAGSRLIKLDEVRRRRGPPRLEHGEDREADDEQGGERRPFAFPSGGRSDGRAHPAAAESLGRVSARIATITKAAPPRMVKIEAIPCTPMPAAATGSSEPTPLGVLRNAP